MRFFLLHFAGGNKYSFKRIFKDSRFKTLEIDRENSQVDIDDIVDDLISKNFSQLYNEPYCIYGHSMGGLLAYLLCQKLQEKKLPMPEKLIVSGKLPPSMPRKKLISHLPDQEFWDEVVALGGMPDEIKEYPELIEYYMPILRFDFKLVEDYRHEQKNKLTIPIDAFFGSEETTYEEMEDWKNESIQEVKITQLEGNHFFIFDHPDYFKNYFNTLITKSIC
ncbi:thioesterase II family protein [Flavobacterium sp. H122]|uniref:thioesterase II family protein n=1 Tax=Flavobacterium sp. H122 TaxID=2529860 RepID=UPI0010AA1DC2|nr:thioesterase domain-containing protein [Flavobacterium sp. H122]